VSDEFPKERIFHEFNARDIDIKKIMEFGQLIFLTSKETYLKEGSFNPNKMISLLRESEKEAIKEGYSGIRIIGEASCITCGAKGTDKFMEYESEVNMFIFGSKICAICLYNENRLDHDLLSESIHCHPDVIFYGKLCENPYYSPRLIGTTPPLPIPSGSYELIKQDFLREDKDIF
jgi:HTH-type transcriptional regulator, bacterioopsin transcriptional activator and related proteins